MIDFCVIVVKGSVQREVGRVWGHDDVVAMIYSIVAAPGVLLSL